MRRLLHAIIAARCDYPCPAVQKAIDDLATEFRDGRAGLLAYLLREPNCMPKLAGGSWGPAWFGEALKLATTHDHRWWFGTCAAVGIEP